MIAKLIFEALALILLFSTFFMLGAYQPIINLMVLITIFASSAGIFGALGFYFLGLTYIIVYVGAIAILFLFVIMMAEIPLSPD